jgi:threonine synthase
MLSLGEGGTPLRREKWLAEWAGVETVWVKREDQNPTGSHKDRGARAQLEACMARGDRVAVISSSGNAALAAATYGRAAGVQVVALISPMTEPGRAAAIREAGARVVVTTKPINYTIRLSRVCGWPDLRPSQSPEALAGFRTLGEELAAELPGEDIALFGYASSGTTYQAVGEALAERGSRVALHPVQAGLVNGLSAAFDRPGEGKRSIVGDLGVKHSNRTDDVVRLVRASGGEAWWVGDNAIIEAGHFLEEQGYALARECWAALAGLGLAAETNGISQACLLLTGRAAPASVDDAQAGTAIDAIGSVPHPATEFREVVDLVADLR